MKSEAAVCVSSLLGQRGPYRVMREALGGRACVRYPECIPMCNPYTQSRPERCVITAEAQWEGDKGNEICPCQASKVRATYSHQPSRLLGTR